MCTGELAELCTWWRFVILVHLVILNDDVYFGEMMKCELYVCDWMILLLEQWCFTSHLLSFDNNKVLKIINWIC